MTVTIKSEITRSVPAENTYRLAVTIIDAINIEFDVLVFDTETKSFSRVASVYDMEVYPISQEAAKAAGLAYYRGRTCTVEYSTIRDATGFEQVTKNRLKLLAIAWNSMISSFEGSSIITSSSSVS